MELTENFIGLNAAQMAGGQAVREAADEAIMGDQSRRAIRLRELMEQGLSQAQAEKVLFEQDLRDLGSIAPIVAGLTQNSVIRGMRAAGDVGESVRRYEDGDMEIAKILQEDAPRKPFTEEMEGGIMKNGNKMPDSDSPIKDAQYQNFDAYKNIDPELFRGLETSGVKYTAEDVITLVKNHEGKLLWLEKGDQDSGLIHIFQEHSDDFARRQIDDSVQFLRDIIHIPPVKINKALKGFSADYIVEGKLYRLAYGTNGYIVSFYPVHK